MMKMIQRKRNYCPDPVKVLGFIDGLMNGTIEV